MKSTGERMIPKLNQGAVFYYEHLARYYFASQFCNNKNVIDIACGSGYGSELIKNIGKAKSVTGVDISAEAIEYAKENYSANGIDFTIGNAIDLSNLKQHIFDVAVSFETIEHIAEQSIFIKKIKEKIKKDGILVVSTPNVLNYPKGNKFHVKELTQKEFETLLKSNFKNVTFVYQKFCISNKISSDLSKTNVITATQNINSSISSADNSEYLIAICSDSDIPNFLDFSLDTDRIDWLDFEKGYLSSIKIMDENQKLNQDKTKLKFENEKKSEEITRLNQILKEKEEKELKEENDRAEVKNLEDQINLENHKIYELEQSLKKIRSAKAFKLWRLYCKIKKNNGRDK